MLQQQHRTSFCETAVGEGVGSRVSRRAAGEEGRAKAHRILMASDCNWGSQSNKVTVEWASTSPATTCSRGRRTRCHHRTLFRVLLFGTTVSTHARTPRTISNLFIIVCTPLRVHLIIEIIDFYLSKNSF